MASVPDPIASPGLSAVPRRRWFQPPTGLAGGVFWLAVWFGLLWLLRRTPAPGQTFLGWMQTLVGIGLIALAAPLLLRIVRRRFLWRLSNKLTVTYLLIGLAPFVLFLTLVALSAYVAAGQFSIHLADSRMHQQLDQIGIENSARATGLARVLRGRGPQPFAQQTERRGPGEARRLDGRRGPRPVSTPPAVSAANPASPSPAQASAQAAAAAALGEVPPNPLLSRLHRHTQVYLNGQPLALPTGPPGAPTAEPGGPPQAASDSSVPLGLPPWASDLHGNQFRNLVLDGQDLYLVAIDQRHVEGSGTLTVVTSLPVNAALMDVIAEGLGRVRLSSLMTGSPQVSFTQSTQAPKIRVRTIDRQDIDRSSVYGGEEPRAVNFCDFGVPFLSTMDVRDWETNDQDNVPIVVHSRPSVLYSQLFGSSISGFVTSSIRIGFISLCVVFGIIESVALWAALRLSRQITTSVEELYAATQRVDRGDLTHRIPAHTARQDQLGELSRSFNRMTGSLERLLAEQQEKERLQNELAIAQEVQANLFPRHVHNLPNLEMHGICRPARTVSGDYYDFLIFRSPGASAAEAGPESGVGIALGDISGKGISAALLMATLHSAVRAYRLAGQDLIVTSSGSAAGSEITINPPLREDDGTLFSSPARILSLVNRHLYLSTQPEKYATLFLAHYDAATAQLTYSNAGHLPPLILGRDGNLRRLDCGGTVVGLIEGADYEEGHLHMKPGDIFIAYSDGVTEPENDFGEFGEARLIETIARYRDQPLHVISSQVMRALDAWIGASEQPDDITLVLARQA